MAKKDEIILRELAQWRDQGMIDQATHDRLAPQYQGRTWDFATIIRWSLIMGAVMLGVGLISFITLIIHTLSFVALVLTILCAAAFWYGFQLADPQRGRFFPRTGNALIAVACLLLCGDVFTVGKLLSSGSGHWPVLLLVTSAIYFVVAYGTKNTLVLVFALLGLATWFGTESGYVSGWGAYYMGLNYPMRFAIASPLVVAAGYLHRRFAHGLPDSFARTYYSLGLFYLNLSLWVMSIFGNYGDMHSWQSVRQYQLLWFTVIWTVVIAAIFAIGARSRNRMFVNYAIVFGVIDLYTRYFEYFWNELHKSLFFIILGAVSVATGLFFERKLKRRRVKGID
jgi:uncharacterized membrane protein